MELATSGMTVILPANASGEEVGEKESTQHMGIQVSVLDLYC